MIINCKSQTATYKQRDGIVASFFNDVRKYQLLNRNEEVELLKKAHSKDIFEKQDAIDKIVRANQRFVISAAMKFATDDNLLDLINEGNIGLITAIERFDFTKDVKFITYAAWWVHKAINMYLTEFTNLVVPANANKLRTVVNKAKHKFFIANQRTPTLEELQEFIKEHYNFNVKNISDLETIQSISIDESGVNDSEEEAFQDNAAFSNVTATNNIDDDVEEFDNKTMVNKLLKKLNKNDQDLIKKVFGIGCMEYTYEAVGDELNLSKERVRQKVNDIIKKLGRMTYQKVV